MFTPETYINRRMVLRNTLKTGMLLFLGNDDCGMNYADNTYHFRQDSTFLYYFGLDYPGLAAVIDIDNGREIVFGDELTMDQIVWMGSQPTIREKCDWIGIVDVMPSNKLKAYIEKEIKYGRIIHYLPPYRPEHQLKLYDLLGISPFQQQINSSHIFIKGVVNQRIYKSDEEIIQLEEAVNISADMHIHAMRMIRPGMKEADVAAAVTEIALSREGNLSFPVIATINGQTLHNHYHGNVLREGDMLLLDAGAENKMHYAGDLSSTIPVSGRFTSRQRDIYSIALDAHQTAVKLLRPGIPFKEIHMVACRRIVEGLKDLGLMRGHIDLAVEEGAHALFFQCGLGHMMGLDVHDMENLGELWVGYDGSPKSTLFGLKSLRLARKLERRFVLTIEPGIYFIPELIDMWKSEKRHAEFINYDKVEEYRNFGGIRNEEDYLITDDGARRLGKHVPISIDEVEAVREKSFTYSSTH